MAAPRSLSAAGAAALALIAAFVVLQGLTLDYGTRINDFPFIRDYRVTSDVFQHSGLNRGQLVGSENRAPESLDLWMVRFKLYPVEADEVVNLIALARIDPARLQFDPGYYQYGGAFLYPLGAWYFALSKLGVIQVAPLDRMLAVPQAIDRIWIAGRLFVLLAFALSALLLFLMLSELAPGGVAFVALAIYLLCPASIMFSQVVKPHWYALLWVNGALLILARAAMRRSLPLGAEVLLGACIGLAVGSAITFSLFAVLAWGALALLALRGAVGVLTLARVPAVALLVFAATNPYYILNWHAVQVERSAAANWFEPSLSLDAIAGFVTNSLFSGFGIALTLSLLAVAALYLVRGPLGARLLAVAVLLPIVVIATLTANLATWNVNYRYIAYVLPAALALLAARPWPRRLPILIACAVATIVQAVPLKLAYVDENSDVHSTRLAAAAWIDAHVPETDAICAATATVVPYDVPPFRFDRHPINTPDCRWTVHVERQPRSVRIDPAYAIAQRFTPRLSPRVFPLVWENINPQITVYRRRD